MVDFLTALGLVFVIEGVVLSLFPGACKDIMTRLLSVEDKILRYMGLATAVFGFLVVAVIKGL